MKFTRPTFTAKPPQQETDQTKFRRAVVRNLFYDKLWVMQDSDETIGDDIFVTVKMENGRLVKMKKDALEYV